MDFRSIKDKIDLLNNVWIDDRTDALRKKVSKCGETDEWMIPRMYRRENRFFLSIPAHKRRTDRQTETNR